MTLVNGQAHLLISPVQIVAVIEHGHGRGRAQLGIPTANFPTNTSRRLIEMLGRTGIYYGLATILGGGNQYYYAVASLGWNPFFHDPHPTFEVHLIDYEGSDFYGESLAVHIIGYLRPEKDFTSIENLKNAIDSDKLKAIEELNKCELLSFHSNRLYDFANKLAP